MGMTERGAIERGVGADPRVGEREDHPFKAGAAWVEM